MPQPMTRPALRLRPLARSEGDYVQLTRLWNATEPDHPVTVEETRFDHESRPAKIRWGGVLAELARKVVGYASYSHQELTFHPQRFQVGVRVLPEHGRQGIGSALYQALLKVLAPLEPLELQATVDEARPWALAFAEKRGFREVARFFESRLSLGSFDPSPYAGLEAKLAGQGIRLALLSELTETTPDYRERIYWLDWICTQDEPLTDAPVKPEREAWLAQHFGRPDFRPDTYLVALDGERWIGLNQLRPLADSRVVYNGFTAVLRAYRGRGVATALKVKNLRWALQQGYHEVRTWNSSLNGPMLAVNQRLGFVREPADIAMKKLVLEA